MRESSGSARKSRELRCVRARERAGSLRQDPPLQAPALDKPGVALCLAQRLGCPSPPGWSVFLLSFLF